MSERYTKADVTRILANVNAAAKRLNMSGAYAVETMGGTYLYLTDRASLTPDHTGPGTKLLDLGKSWNAAGSALLSVLQAWHVVEMMTEAGR